MKVESKWINVLGSNYTFNGHQQGNLTIYRAEVIFSNSDGYSDCIRRKIEKDLTEHAFDDKDIINISAKPKIYSDDVFEMVISITVIQGI